jgi:hypothetical protein
MPSRFDEAYSVDTKKDGFVVDMRPTTLLEQSLMGNDRVNMPVGEAITEAAEYQTTGGARLGDAIDAIRIGANGRKK